MNCDRNCTKKEAKMFYVSLLKRFAAWKDSVGDVNPQFVYYATELVALGRLSEGRPAPGSASKKTPPATEESNHSPQRKSLFHQQQPDNSAKQTKGPLNLPTFAEFSLRPADAHSCADISQCRQAIVARLENPLGSVQPHELREIGAEVEQLLQQCWQHLQVGLDDEAQASLRQEIAALEALSAVVNRFTAARPPKSLLTDELDVALAPFHESKSLSKKERGGRPVSAKKQSNMQPFSLSDHGKLLLSNPEEELSRISHRSPSQASGPIWDKPLPGSPSLQSVASDYALSPREKGEQVGREEFRPAARPPTLMAGQRDRPREESRKQTLLRENGELIRQLNDLVKHEQRLKDNFERCHAMRAFEKTAVTSNVARLLLEKQKQLELLTQKHAELRQFMGVEDAEPLIETGRDPLPSRRAYRDPVRYSPLHFSSRYVAPIQRFDRRASSGYFGHDTRRESSPLKFVDEIYSEINATLRNKLR